MKIRYCTILLMTLTMAELFPQSLNTYIVSVSLNDEMKNNKIESLELPYLYIINEHLITNVNSEKLDELKNTGVEFLVLDEILTSDKIFLITSKSSYDLNTLLSGEDVILAHSNTAIIKNFSGQLSELLQSKCNITELRSTVIFKNEKTLWQPSSNFSSDSLITQITSSINVDSVRYVIQSLQDFQTRFLYADTRDAVAEWLKNRFLEIGFTDVVIDSFEFSGTWQKNVIATLQGIYEPQIYNIVGGHQDSYSSGDPMIFAPGADDNASGTAAVLEIARVIKKHNYQPESTIKFVTFAAEEYGLWGSVDYAQKAFYSGMDIKIMINHDMISHTYYPAAQSHVDVNRYSGFEYLRDLAFYCIENYSVLTPSNGSLNSGGSDSYSFWERGYPSVYFEENNFSPYYHSPADTIGNYSMEYCAEVIKASCATLIMNIVMPTSVKNYELVDAGTRQSLFLSWSPNLSPDFDHYKIQVGTQSGVYFNSFTTSDTVLTIGNLIEGTTYYVGVSVVDLDGYESLIVERSAIPFELPTAPREFTASPLWHEINFTWLGNNEYDLLGYNLYRSNIQGQLGNKLNQNIITDTIFVDNSAANGIYYYYTVKSVDSLLNESINNTILRSRVVSLDQGILLVDETANGDGSPMHPTDAGVDNFYDDILTNFNVVQYDMDEEGEINLADFGAYSSVIWHGNDLTDMDSPFNAKNEIIKYLNFGGNFIYTGYRPSKAFENIGGLTGNFSNGDFIFDYLKIQETKGTIFALFNQAKRSTTGYNNIFVDSSKSLSSDQYHLKNIEMIKPSPDGTSIYTFETNFDSTTQQGILKGKPIGVEYIGNDYKTVTISFPLYYMNKDQARSLIEYVLMNKFNEVMPVDDAVQTIPTEYELFQNYPNPFNPSTTINYSIPEEGFVKLKIYNMLGEEVATIVNTTQKAGRYEVSFDATGLSSGVYVYRIEALNFTASKKLILMK